MCLVPLAILAGLTCQQSRMYSDMDTLYRWTIEENPGGWMAYNNLGTVMLDRGRLDEAMRLLQQALKIKPDSKNVHNNIGLGLSKQGKLDEAIVEYHKSLAIRPDYLNARMNLGLALYNQGHYAEAIASIGKRSRSILALPPRITAWATLCWRKTSWTRRQASFGKALAMRQNNVNAHNNLGAALCRQGRLAEARVECEEAVRLNPQLGEAYGNLGDIALQQAKYEEAMVVYGKALRCGPTSTMPATIWPWCYTNTGE